MRILVYSDLQADIGNERLFSNPAESLRLHCVSKFYADLRNIYETHNCQALFDLGDTFDDRTAIDIPTINTVIKGLEWLPASDLHTRLIGNHDQYQRDGSVHNGRLLSPYFRVIDSTETQMLGSLCLFFVSYPSDYDDLCQWLVCQARRIRGPKILFGHFNVQGAFYQNATVLHGVPQEMLQPFNLVLLGHIHLPQSVTPRIHYVGSPFQQDWGETGQSKRVAIVDTQTLQVEWVPMTGYPEYRKLTLAEFESLAGEKSEHRYRVTLNSHEESEQFFRLPYFNRATAQYNYDETPQDQADEDLDWTFEGTCRRYLRMVPPSKVGIELPDDEMLDITHHILRG